MPMSPPYNNMVLLAAGGSTANNAGFNTPADNRAWAISVSGSPALAVPERAEKAEQTALLPLLRHPRHLKPCC